MNKCKFLILTAITAMFLSVNVYAQIIEDNAAEEAEEEAVSESADLIDRLSFASAGNRLQQRAFSGQANINLVQSVPFGASADLNAILPESAWVSTSWSEISDDGIGNQVDADTYLITGGVDKQFGNWFFGLSSTYAYTETEIGGLFTQGDTHSISVAPYAAYTITPSIFISGITSYTYSSFEPGVRGANADRESDIFTTELTINGFTSINDIALIGKTGVRYAHTETDFDVGADNNRDDWIYLVEAKFGYSFDNFVKGLNGYTTALYEYIETDNGEDDGVLYLSGGVDYTVNKDLTIGIEYSRDVNNEDFDINTVTLNGSLSF